MSEEDEERIRKDYAKGMGYRGLSKKYRKSMTQLAKILRNPKGLSERVEELEKSRWKWDLAYEGDSFEDGIHAWAMHREDFVPWCIECHKPMEYLEEEKWWKCPDCENTWP